MVFGHRGDGGAGAGERGPGRLDPRRRHDGAVTIPDPVQLSATSASTAGAGTDAGTATLVDAGGGSFTTGVADLAPGDYFYRYVDVRNDGPGPATITGTVGADGALAGYLAVEATACALPWDTTGGAGTCSDPAPLGAGVPTAGATVTVTHGQVATGDAGASTCATASPSPPSRPSTSRATAAPSPSRSGPPQTADD